MPNSLANGLRTQLFSITTSSTGEGPGQVFFLPLPGIQKHQLWPELPGGQANLSGSSAEAFLRSPRSPERGHRPASSGASVLGPSASGKGLTGQIEHTDQSTPGGPLAEKSIFLI